VRIEQSVRVQCLSCGDVGVLTAETLSRRAIAPSKAPPASARENVSHQCRRGAQNPWPKWPRDCFPGAFTGLTFKIPLKLGG
jgi:hypothetical protein